MRLHECHRLCGRIELRAYRHGRLVWTWDDDNLIVDVGRDATARLLGEGDTNKIVSQIGFGTSNTPADVSDTALTGGLTKALAGHSYPAARQVAFDFTLDEGEGNGLDIWELGLLCADGTLLSRKVRSAPIEKTSDLSLEGTWTLEVS